MRRAIPLIILVLAIYSTVTMAQGGSNVYAPIVYSVGGTPTVTVTGTQSPTVTNEPTNTATITLTLTRTPRTTVTVTASSTPYTPTPTPAIVENGDFEQGPGIGWQEQSDSGLTLIVNRNEGDPPLPTWNGEWLAWLGGSHDEHATLSQSINVPSTAASFVSFRYYIDSEGACGVGGDYVNILINGQVESSISLCSDKNTTEYVPGLVDVPYFSDVTITFEIFTDASELSSFYLDDVRVQTDQP